MVRDCDWRTPLWANVTSVAASTRAAAVIDLKIRAVIRETFMACFCSGGTIRMNTGVAGTSSGCRAGKRSYPQKQIWAAAPRSAAQTVCQPTYAWPNRALPLICIATSGTAAGPHLSTIHQRRFAISPPALQSAVRWSRFPKQWPPDRTFHSWRSEDPRACHDPACGPRVRH